MYQSITADTAANDRKTVNNHKIYQQFDKKIEKS
jgi:hypothetical protein